MSEQEKEAGLKPGEEEITDNSSETAGGGDDTAQGSNAEDEAREAFLRQIEERATAAAIKAAETIVSRTSPGRRDPDEISPATSEDQAIAELKAEGRSLERELATLDTAIKEGKGNAADLLIQRQDIMDRRARWYNNVTLLGMKLGDAKNQVKEKGTEEEWLAFCSKYPIGTDVQLLRDAFERRKEKEKGSSKPPEKTTSGGSKPRIIVDVSGSSEVSANVKKKRETIKSADLDAEYDRLRNDESLDEATRREKMADIAKQIRNKTRQLVD